MPAAPVPAAPAKQPPARGAHAGPRATARRLDRRPGSRHLAPPEPRPPRWSTARRRRLHRRRPRHAPPVHHRRLPAPTARPPRLRQPLVWPVRLVRRRPASSWQAHPPAAPRPPRRNQRRVRRRAARPTARRGRQQCLLDNAHDVYSPRVAGCASRGADRAPSRSPGPALPGRRRPLGGRLARPARARAGAQA